MNKKEHKIWKEIKHDEYLSHGHIFSFEKQLKFQGKMVLDYIVHESEDTYKTFYELDKLNKSDNKEVTIESISYDNKNHHIWKYNDPYIEEDFLEASLYERYLLENGKCILPYQCFTNVKLWS